LKAIVVASLLMVSGWAYSRVSTEIPTTARQQNLTAPPEPPPNAAALRADVLIVEGEMLAVGVQRNADKGEANYSWRNAAIGSTRMARRVGR
jgi:hypothetical protein